MERMTDAEFFGLFGLTFEESLTWRWSANQRETWASRRYRELTCGLRAHHYIESEEGTNGLD